MNLRLYSFVDNHDVERIWTKLREKAHFLPVHILLYTLPGMPSIYYGSEFGIEGRKTPGSDAPLRPALNLDDFRDNTQAKLIAALGRIRQGNKVLCYGDYTQLHLTTTQYAFSRSCGQWDVLVAVNNEGSTATLKLHARCGSYTGALSGVRVTANDGHIHFTLGGNAGEIWIPDGLGSADLTPVLEQVRQKLRSAQTQQSAPAKQQSTPVAAPQGKPYEHMTVPELQQAILDKMAKNGPVTDRMRQDVVENIWRDSLITWVKSFQ
jgi:hypothetical protein